MEKAILDRTPDANLAGIDKEGKLNQAQPIRDHVPSTQIVKVASQVFKRAVGKVFVANKTSTFLTGSHAMDLEGAVLELHAPAVEVQALEELQPEAPEERLLPEVRPQAEVPPPERPAAVPQLLPMGDMPNRWVSGTTQAKVIAAVGPSPNYTCKHCGHECPSRKRLLVHAKLHWVQSFCVCGYNSRWKETIRKHQVSPHIQCS